MGLRRLDVPAPGKPGDEAPSKAINMVLSFIVLEMGMASFFLNNDMFDCPTPRSSPRGIRRQR